jgi:hypothetical protein
LETSVSGGLIPNQEHSLNTGIIANAAGIDNALTAGTLILLVVAVVYIISLVGLVGKKTWGPLLVIAISIPNRLLALFLYFISFAFAFWTIWTTILVLVALLDYRRSNVAQTATSPEST